MTTVEETTETTGTTEETEGEETEGEGEETEGEEGEETEGEESEEDDDGTGNARHGGPGSAQSASLEPSSGASLSSGSIAGIAAGIFACLACISLAILAALWRRRKRRMEPSHESETEPDGHGIGLQKSHSQREMLGSRSLGSREHRRREESTSGTELATISSDARPEQEDRSSVEPTTDDDNGLQDEPL